jgi:hypothetical protein
MDGRPEGPGQSRESVLPRVIPGNSSVTFSFNMAHNVIELPCRTS